ncbi:MAG: hypothetical protein ACFB10_20810 [Salibacteraceae bacterium]
MRFSVGLFFFAGVVAFCLSSCDFRKQPPELSFDHLVLFVEQGDSIDRFFHQHFTLAEKATTVHDSQGTEGHYFLFFNTFVELLYLNDSSKAVENETRFGSAYIPRWSPEYCPIGVGLQLMPFDTSGMSALYHTYSSINDGSFNFYWMPKANRNQEQPLLYISEPERSYHQFESLEEVDEKVEDFKREDVKRYLTHPKGMQRLSKIRIEVSADQLNGKNVATLNRLPQVEVSRGDGYRIVLEFDDHRRRKRLKSGGKLPLEVHY